MAGNASFDALISTTLANYQKKLTDNVFNDRVLTWYLKDKGQVKLRGGTKIIEPLLYADNSTFGSYSGYDPIELTPQEGITAAEYEWRQLATSIAISGIEEAKNNGEQAVLDLLEAKVFQAEETMKEGLNTMLFADGSGNSSKDFNGLGNLVESGNTVGGIDSSALDNTWWRSYEENTGGALTEAYMRTAYNSVSRGKDQPDIALTTQTLFEKFESLLTPQVRYSDVKMANLGFQNLMFKGAPVVYDPACTSGTMYFLNSKYIKLVGHSDRWFTQTPFVRPENMDARYSLITAYGNLTVSNRKRLGKLTGKTA
jgi:hypothetical protein